MDYLNTFEKAIIYIEANLSNDINVNDVAKEVGYSYYHLTRMFQAIVGESIGNYIKKRRLSNGAYELLYSDKKIIEIALENGFNSPEAFSRAFKLVYKVSPVKYRNNRLNVFMGNKKEIDTDFLKHIAKNITIEPKIKYIEDIYVRGIEGRVKVDNIYSLWKKFAKIIEKIPNKHHSKRTFGICNQLDDMHKVNYDMDLLEIVGVEVIDNEKLADNTVLITIPAGKYAVFTHSGSIDNIIKTYEYIWGTWLVLTKEKLDNRLHFEFYDERFLGKDNKDSKMDIYIPIK